MDAFVMLQELLEQEQFELIQGKDIRLVYLMNDAVESFLVFRNAHAEVVDLLNERLKEAVSGYKKRSFGEEMDRRCIELLREVEKRQKQLQEEGKESVILREEPFEVAKDSIGYQIHLMIWEKKLLNRKVSVESYPLHGNT